MGFFDKLKQGLNKTKESINEKINDVFSNFRKVDLLTEELTKAASDYPERRFDEKEEKEHKILLERAKQEQRKLKEQGIKADIVREEPFITSRDSLRYKVYLMEWRSKRGNRIVKIKEINN